MADFQSFLFQNMHSIGLEDEEQTFDDTLNMNKTSSKIDNINNKSNKINNSSNNKASKSKSSITSSLISQSSSNSSNSSKLSAPKAKQSSFADYLMNTNNHNNISNEDDSIKSLNSFNPTSNFNGNKNLKKDNNQSNFKTFGSISVSTTETYISNTNFNKNDFKYTNEKFKHLNLKNNNNNNSNNIRTFHNHDDDQNDEDENDDDPYDLNNQEPKFIRKKSIEPENDSHLHHLNYPNVELISETILEHKLPSNEFYVKKDQLFEANLTDLDTNYIIGNDYDYEIMKEGMLMNRMNRTESTRDLSSPESLRKFDFKASTPKDLKIDYRLKKNSCSTTNINHTKNLNYNQQYHKQSLSCDIDSTDERDVKSPKPIASNNNQIKDPDHFRKFSPCRSIFDKKTMSIVSINSFNEDESLHRNIRFKQDSDESLKKMNYSSNNSNYQVKSKLFNDPNKNKNRKKFDDLTLNTTSSDDEVGVNKTNSSIESVLMEPYLNKFEEELIKNSKSEVIKDLNHLSSSNLQKISPSISNNNNINNNNNSSVFSKYLKEIKNLTLKKPKQKPQEQLKYQESNDTKDIEYEEEIIYAENPSNKSNNKDLKSNETKLKPELNRENLRKISRPILPWQNLDPESANSLLDSVVQNLNQLIEEYPILFSKKGNKISQNQVKRWHEALEKLANTDLSPPKASVLDSDASSITKDSIQTKSSSKISGKQFLLNKKRQILDKVSKKTTKTLSDLSHSCNELTKSVSKLYANVLVEDKDKSHKDKSNSNNKNQKLDDTLTDSMSIATHTEINEQKSSKNDHNKKERAKHRSPSVKESVLEISHYVNENFFPNKNEKPKSQSTPKKQANSESNADIDHFYNEINEADSKQAMMAKHRSREKERDRVIREAEATKKPTRPQRSTEKTNQTKSQSQSNQSQSKIDSSSKQREDFKNHLKQLTTDLSENSQTNMILKRNLAQITKLKSPERKILYKDWFSILKRMEKDPKFDLEALIRTRGRFTEHERIGYREKTNDKNQKLRCARSEPNFGAFMYPNQSSQNMVRSRGGINTAPASKARVNYDPSQKEGARRNFSDSRSNNGIRAKGGSNSEQSRQTSAEAKADALKLTLERKDINKIKEILRKKDKSLKTDLISLKQETNQRKLITKKQQRINSQGIIDEECEENEDDNDHNSKSKLNRNFTNFIKNTRNNLRKHNSNESILESDRMDDDKNKKNNILVSKCKNMYNKSETAKALCDEVTKIKGKIGSKLKNFSQSSSKFIQKSIMDKNHSDDQIEDSPEQIRKNRGKNSQGLNSRSHRSIPEIDTSASVTLSSSNSSEEEEVPVRPNRSHHDRNQKDSNSRSRLDSQQIKNSSKQSSSKVSPSPARPPPPKRPPPPRPYSPSTSFANYSPKQKPSSSKNRPGGSRSNKHDEFDRSHSETPPLAPKRSSNNLPPRPPVPSQLPPRPPSVNQNKRITSRSNRNDDSPSEMEDRRIRTRNNESNTRHIKRSTDEIRKKTSSSSISSISNSRSTTPTKSPLPSAESRTKTNIHRKVNEQNRRDVSRR